MSDRVHELSIVVCADADVPDSVVDERVLDALLSAAWANGHKIGVLHADASAEKWQEVVAAIQRVRDLASSLVSNGGGNSVKDRAERQIGIDIYRALDGDA